MALLVGQLAVGFAHERPERLGGEGVQVGHGQGAVGRTGHGREICRLTGKRARVG